MPNLEQTKKAKEIKDPEMRRKYLKYLQLPQNLQEIMFAPKTANKIWDLCQKYQLNNEQTEAVSHTIGLVVLSETDIADFTKTLQEKCKLDESITQELAQDINQQIFLTVREELESLHPQEKPAIPQESEPPLQGLQGNVVNLKEN